MNYQTLRTASAVHPRSLEPSLWNKCDITLNRSSTEHGICPSYRKFSIRDFIWNRCWKLVFFENL